MKKQLLIIGIIVLLVCVGLSGCEQRKINDDTSKFIGRWTGEISNLSGLWNLTFLKNGSVLISYDVGLESLNMPAHWEKYEIKDKQLCLPIRPNIEPVCLNYEFSNNDTYLETTGDVHFMLEKINELNKFIGRWNIWIPAGTLSVDWVFNSNGTIKEESYHVFNTTIMWLDYSLDDGIICINPSLWSRGPEMTRQEECYSYTFTNNNLNLTLNSSLDNSELHLNKKDENIDSSKFIGTWDQVFYSGIRGTRWTFYNNGTIREVTGGLSSWSEYNGTYEIKDGRLCIEGDIGISTWSEEQRMKLGGCHIYEFVDNDTFKLLNGEIYFSKN